MFRLLYPDSYLRKAKKFFKKHPELIAQYQKTLELLEFNPYHPSLRLHKLHGHLEGLCSVSINMSYRLILQLIITEKEILLIDVGKHEQVY
jgi:addiction module RelE/StbE family toxin